MGGMLIRETFAAAAKDAELVADECQKKNSIFLKQVQSLFAEIDTDGDGMVCEEEYVRVARDARFKKMLETLQVNPHKAGYLFRLLDTENGKLTCQQLVAGISNLRGDAKKVDVVNVLYETQKLRKLLHADE